jgi:hypothetical protein
MKGSTTQGGSTYSGGAGGLGAEVAGDFTLISDETLDIAVCGLPEAAKDAVSWSRDPGE